MKSIGLLCVAVVCGLAKDVGSPQSEPDMKAILGSKNEARDLYMDPRSSTVSFVFSLGTWLGMNQPFAPAFCGGWVNHGPDIKKAMPPNCFQVNQTSTGVYVVVFTPPLRGLPLCTGNQIFPASFDYHGNTRDNIVIMNADMSKMAYATGDQYGRPSNRDVTFLCIA